MELIKRKKESKVVPKKEKKLKKLINKSDSDSEESEHELSHYLNDRVKLMKEVLKIIKPKKIKSMAPDCMKNLDIQEINSMLLEELLGISNKRLKYIFNGQNLEEDSSSTDPETEQQPIDIISLDDVTDDDFVIDLDSDVEIDKKRHKKHKPKIKEEGKRKKIKKEKQEKSDHEKPSKKSKDKMDEQNLMSVLELLELQARARAIRSQLALENSRKAEEQEKNEAQNVEESDNDDAVIIESSKNIEIVIMSSESENESDSGNQRKLSCQTHEPNKKETDTNIKNVSKPPEKVNNKENINTVTLESNNTRNETEAEMANKNKETELSEDKKDTQTKVKIANIETVIIIPAKTTVTGNTEKERDVEMKNIESTEDVNNDVKKDSGKSSIIEQQSGTVDEGDGIIINMEPSEMDYIISD